MFSHFLIAVQCYVLHPNRQLKAYTQMRTFCSRGMRKIHFNLHDFTSLLLSQGFGTTDLFFLCLSPPAICYCRPDCENKRLLISLLNNRAHSVIKNRLWGLLQSLLQVCWLKAGLRCYIYCSSVVFWSTCTGWDLNTVHSTILCVLRKTVARLLKLWSP